MYERVFERDGVQVSTAVPAQAVRLLSEGYREVLDDTPKPDLSRVQPPQLRPDLPGRAPADERNNAPD